MHIIAKGREDCIKFWNTSTELDVPYRLMKYLVSANCEQGMLLLNTVTGELVLLNSDEIAATNNLPALPSDNLKELVHKRFLVPSEFDELKLVNQLRSVLQKLKSSDEITGYTILPTSACNARCFYCYESDVPSYTMTKKTACQVVNYIEAHRGNSKNVEIHWFGGEPTLGSDRIDDICDGLTNKDIVYESTMISNGYLFSRSMAQKAKEKWHLRSVQITLDGTQEIYNQTKAYVNAKGNPYACVLDNIGYLLDEKIRVVVRMNLGFHNADDLKLLINEIANRFSKKEGFSAYVHELFEDQGFTPLIHSENERNELVKIKNALNSYIREKGCKNADDSKKLPALKVFYCMADTPTSLLINPLGQLGKCEHMLYSHMVGDIVKGHDFNSPTANYWLHPKYCETCKECELFPYCGQVETCETNSVCFSDNIRKSIIDSVRIKMMKAYEGGTSNEKTRS